MGEKRKQEHKKKFASHNFPKPENDMFFHEIIIEKLNIAKNQLNSKYIYTIYQVIAEERI
jgi:hypothetical protein